MNKNHHKKDKNIPTGSSVSNALAKFFLCGILRSSLLSKALSLVVLSVNSFDSPLILTSSDSTTIESGLGGAGISGTGKGVIEVIPRSGAGGGLIFTFFGGNGGVVEFCLVKLLEVCLVFDAS